MAETEDYDFNVGRVAISVRADARSLTGVPVSAARGAAKVEGTAREALFTSSDGLRLNVAVVTWPDGSQDVQPLDFIAGPDVYRRLERAGRMTLMDTGRGTKCALLRALKYGDREYPSLASTTWQELSWLAGTDVQELLLSHGAEAVESYATLRSDARRFADNPAFECATDALTPIFAAFAITRVLPIMKEFGRSGVEVLHS